jgi:branched-chain amino acid transport system substrate-binding protein
MTQKKETAVLLLSLLITLGAIAFGWWWLTRSGKLNLFKSLPDISQQSQLSIGDKLLISQNATPEKRAAVTALAEENYQQAVINLELSLKKQRNDPEALIYLNNARIGNGEAYTVATAVPIGVEINVAQEILRGVAQAQNEINAAGGINGKPLKVVLADDRNDPETAQKVAQAFVNNADILGVIGHFTSNVTTAAAEVYQKQGLVVISATSTAVDLAKAGNYVFRTVPSDLFAGNALSQYLLKTLNKRKAAVFFNSKSDYSSSLQDAFTTDLLTNGGSVVAQFDFSQPGFNAANVVEQANRQGAEVLVLLPNSSSPDTLDKTYLIIEVNNNKLPLIGGDSIYKPQTLQIVGKSAAGMVLAVPWHILGNPNSPFPQAATRLWGGDVNWRSALAYDAAEALIAGIKAKSTRQGVQETLASTNFSTPGASGDIRFFPSGDRNQAVQLVKIVKGDRSGFGSDFVPIP